MPNWCYQNLSVYGKDKKDLDNFIEAIKLGEDKYGLNHLFPTPEELANTESAFGGTEEEQEARNKRYEENNKKYGFKDWYDWNCANWSTKWGACDVEYAGNYEVSDGQKALINFSSAWSPATGLICKISSLHPNLIFALSYTEESNDFAGVEVFVQGFAEGEQNVEIELGNLPEWDEDSDAYYEAYDKFRDSLLSQLSEIELELVDNAKEALPR